ncbi:hypothetical protein O1W68_20515 [Rhodococcus sp. H36-A4]|uniref:hypothetical protein n=1 Tax=Rhodococcus sp. H36-A4 TaxID=3004353 RepID=UPI0022AFDB14|nr:hypothetical protein [Rhodococcus sp. H36-A4]MCZ4080335.1 hypothetical protein [Rhodococcus sp. H36-A4]
MRSLMVIGTLVAAASVSGCGNAIDTDIVGRTALARDADGSVLVLVDACRGSVDSIGIYAGRDGLADSEVNPTLGEIRASSPQSGRIEVPLTAPADPWAADSEVRLSEDPDSLFIVIASLKDENAQAAQVSATQSEVDSLPPGQVLTASSRVVSEAEFHDAC